MKCTKCGMEIPEDSVFCEECGAKLNSKEYRMGAGDAIYCPFCGAGNPVDSVFCEECGKRLSGNAYTMNAGNADEVVYCPSCGADNPVDSMNGPFHPTLTVPLLRPYFISRGDCYDLLKM